jgi:hypothetical protein
MMTTLFNIIAFACIGALWINSEPTIRLRMMYKREDFFYRLINCCMCSTFHIYFWYNLILNYNFDILGASICAILAEFISRKLNTGTLL